MKILWIGLETDVTPNHDVLVMNKHNWDNDRIWSFRPDIVIERELNDKQYNYSSEIAWIRQNFNCIIAGWFIDTHVLYEYHQEKCKSFDYVFMAISKYVDEFKTYNKNTYWLPLCMPCNDLPKKQEKTIDIGFVGRFDIGFLEERSAFLHELETRFPGKCSFITNYTNPYKQMAKSKIQVNPAYADDMNFRNFEALGSGCALVTKFVPDLEKIKGLLERITVYDNVDDCAIHISNLLETELKDESEWIQSHHLLKHRADSMINMILTNKQEEF